MGLLQPNWLAVELDSIDVELEAWSEGIRESFDSLFTKVSQKPARSRRSARRKAKV